MTIVAIDPGMTGSIAILDSHGNHVADMPMPTIKIGSKNRVNGAAVASFIRQYQQYGIDHAFIEKVHSMPKQGVSAVFTFGFAAGVVEGIVTGLGIPLTLITPQQWKKHAGLIGSDKDAARSRAVQLYPGLRTLDAKAKGQALADALLIGRCGLSLVGSGSISEQPVLQSQNG